MDMEEFKKYAEKEGIKITDKTIADLELYLKELLEWNEKFNLTGITEPQDIWHKHFMDSLTVFKSIPEKAIKIIDIGTGAGLPGLVIQILNPRLHVTLMDATGKKVEFLKHMVKILELKNTIAIQNRAEILGHNPSYRESFDVALSRAVALLPTLLEYVLPFVKVGGIFIAQKKDGLEEIETSAEAIKTLGGNIKEKIKIDSEILLERQLILIEKIKGTPKEYPRAEGLAKKRPL
ncbi:MAG: methyltransferase GidB [Candidatus Taylorbacteria bacterium]|nr:methyltransferase GidB [Candidatus Taylorbacteria bacterium]